MDRTFNIHLHHALSDTGFAVQQIASIQFSLKHMPEGEVFKDIAAARKRLTQAQAALDAYEAYLKHAVAA